MSESKRYTKPKTIEVSFKTKSKKELLLYSWSLPKFDYYGTSEYIKMLLQEKMDEEENGNK